MKDTLLFNQYIKDHCFISCNSLLCSWVNCSNCLFKFLLICLKSWMVNYFSATASDSRLTIFFASISSNFNWTLLLIFFYLVSKDRRLLFYYIKSLSCFFNYSISFYLCSLSVLIALPEDSFLSKTGRSSRKYELLSLL